MEDKPLVLVLCTGNSCRSQMAEAILRSVAGDVFEVASAGAKPSGYVHPLASDVMAEIGLPLDPGTYTSKHLEEFITKSVETVITVCGNADEECPSFPGQQYKYCWRFEDPADAEGTEEEQRECFRRIRDQIRLVFEAYGRGRRDQAAEMAGTDRGQGCC
ncbi:MAG: arsenate reductase [Verrucomicrobiales bacterium]|jgi:arsenate reductase